RVFQVPGPLHLEHKLFRSLDVATSGRCDRWVASCRWTYDEYRRLGVPTDRVFLSYYGTDLGSLAVGQRGVLRRELGLGREAPLRGLVAHIYPPKRFIGQTRGLKGHEDFIDAFGMIQQKVPDARGVIVGGPWNGATGYERRLRKRARSICRDGIVFT